MAQKVALVGLSTVGGGLILGPGGITTDGDGFIVSIIGDAIAPHAPFTGLHLAAVMVEGSPDTFVNGRPLCRIGDLASCGHVVDDGDFDLFCL